MDMPDTKALFAQRFDAARTALTAGDEPAAAESLYAAVVVARTDSNLRRELAAALFQLGKLSRKFGRAGEAEAEPLLTEALTITEELFGREDGALVPLLNELSRLHIHRSQYARAEEVLERLLAIARGKSEENADVATALAGLAVVRRKLGDDASAEALFRDALRIREKVLEPSHMVTVVTLEHLSETCAARGNLTEALTLLRRGLATREVVLGPGHATVQVARSRVAELELQVAVAADTAAAAALRAARGAIPTPAWLKRVPDSPVDAPSTTAPSLVDSKKSESPGEPEPRVRRPVALSRDRAKTPAVTAAVAAASLMASPMRTPSASQFAIPQLESVRPSESSSSLASSVAYRDGVLADIGQSDAALSDWRSAAPLQADSPEPARRKRTVLYASAGVGAVAIAMAALLMSRPRAGGGSDPVPTKVGAGQRTNAAIARGGTAPTRPGLAATGAAAVVGATHADSLRLMSAAPAATVPVVKSEQSAPAAATPDLRLPRVDVHVGAINVPKIAVPNLPAPSVDSIARSTTERPRVADTDRTETREVVTPPAPAEVNVAVIPAKIVGRVPEPRFPDALLHSGHREGQVVVRFMVNELGRVDVASMIVERSDHELFTSAVRDILPDFRFEPARTPAPESKPVASWVSVPFRFATKK